ncbi:PEP-CTERM sorting domain-containing protein [Elioraea thermophila]|uniref:PEP-CTERM sorting domain-containing protein n=1 Tax=Elioraea thermophila TaxID=2185104 RepID=UPI000DF39079|nr:PEP-CTERM sorting domain-containing protein [Elioraea thermophila]
MTRTLPFAAALGLAALAAAPAQANLLINPGFESGLTGWTTSGNVFDISCAGIPPGCAPGGGSRIATLNDASLPNTGIGSASLSRAVTVPGPGTFAFGAVFSYATVLPAAGNFTQGQISLTVQGGGPSVTLGFDPNALASQFTISGFAGFSFTAWIPLSGTLAYAGPGPASLLLTISVQNATADNRLVLDVDNVFLRAVTVEVPEPAALALLGLGLVALAALRRAAPARA